MQRNASANFIFNGNKEMYQVDLATPIDKCLAFCHEKLTTMCTLHNRLKIFGMYFGNKILKIPVDSVFYHLEELYRACPR